MDFQPMSPDEMQRMMQFLLNQQAQFAADHAKHNEELAQLRGAWAEQDARFTRQEARFARKTDRLAEALLGLTSIVGQLASSQLRTEKQLRGTDARLNVVIEMFERHLRQDHGQTPPS